MVLKILITLLLAISLVAQADIVEIVSSEQHKQLITSGLPMVIMMGTDWCGYCQEAKPEFAKADAIYSGKVIFAYIDVDRHRIQGIPGVPSYIISGDLETIFQQDTLNQNDSRDVQGIVEYIKRFTGVLP